MGNTVQINFNRDYTKVLMAKQQIRDLSYPPTEIIKLIDGNYVIQMAMAGFKSEQVIIKQIGNTISVDAKAEALADTECIILGGIARRSFERIFEFFDTMAFVSAGLSDGLLRIEVRLVIPAMKKVTEFKVV